MTFSSHAQCATLRIVSDHSWQRADRWALCNEAGGMLTVIGYALRSRMPQTPPPRLAVAVLMQMAGDLVEGALSEVNARHLYAAATLGRQVLEITDLVRYFTLKPDRAGFWLAASDSQMKAAKDFRPAALRKAVGASDQQYSHHCTLGGHPRRMAAVLLPGSSWRGQGRSVEVPGPDGTIDLTLGDALVVDLLQHARPLLIACIEALEPADLEPFAQQIDHLVGEIVRWREQDACAWIGYRDPASD